MLPNQPKSATGPVASIPAPPEAMDSERQRARAMEPLESPQLAETLALAFRDNPLNRAAIRGSARRRMRSNRSGMRATLAAAEGQAMILVPGTSAGPGLGGLIAMAPGVWPLPPPPVFEQVRYLFGQSIGSLRRWARADTVLAELHPAAPHWYLHLLGVSPEARGRGVRAGLLETWLEEVDREGGSAYLETDRQENLSFYGRVGFEVVGSEEILGTPIWLMARPTR